MFLVDVSITDVINEFPIVLDWIDVIKSKFIQSEFNIDKIKVCYSYGFFIPRSKNDDISLQESYEKSLNMSFHERLIIELSKVRVNLTIRMGNCILTNRLTKSKIPSQITDLVTEIIKIRMTIEHEMYGNDEVFNTVPPLSGLISMEIYRHEIEPELLLDVDEILDKITNSGIDSLTDAEKKFLDDRSKEF